MIIAPENDPQKPSADEVAQIEANQLRYDSDPALRKLADEIHHSRMLSGPACSQCICIAISRMEKKNRKTTI